MDMAAIPVFTQEKEAVVKEVQVHMLEDLLRLSSHVLTYLNTTRRGLSTDSAVHVASPVVLVASI